MGQNKGKGDAAVKKLGQRLLALLVCLVLVCGLITTASGGASDLYFMAVNETLIPMTRENMPIMVDGTLYVPYIMFSLAHNGGVNLGVTAQFSTTRRTVMVSQGQNVVIFDPRANTSYDLDGNELDGRAILRNSMAYIPLAWVCEYFGTIQYSTVLTAYGTLVRVTNHLVILDDIEFVDAAAEMIRDNYRDYMDGMDSPGPRPSGEPPASVRPAIGPLVYLAFLGGERMEEMAQILENDGQRGLFLLTVEEMALQGELVRRLVGAGHLVGLNVTDSDPTACLRQAEEGSRLLASLVRCQLTVLRVEGADEALRLLLEEQGYALWQASSRVSGEDSAQSLLRSLDSERPNYVESLCEDAYLALLNEAIGELSGENYRLRLAVAPVL